MVRALDLYPGRPGSNPTIGGKTFPLCFILLLRLSSRWGLVRDWTLLCRKWLHVIINDDFLEKERCYDLALLPSINCLGRIRIACIYSISDTCVRESTLWLSALSTGFLSRQTGFESHDRQEIFSFQLCFIPLLRLSFHKKIYV